MFAIVWSSAPEHAAIQRAKLAAAMQLGKPIRIIVLPGHDLPEDLCAGYGDCLVAHVTTPAQAEAQLQAWLDALP
jgi:hypothetical protein